MSARRQARAARTVEPNADTIGDPVRALIENPDAPIWSDPARWRAFMVSHGWEHLHWLCEDTHPFNRRAVAAENWSRGCGISRPTLYRWLRGGRLPER